MTAPFGVVIGAMASLAETEPISASIADDSATTTSKVRFMKSTPDRISAIADTTSRCWIGSGGGMSKIKRDS
jgi:hypothetical protein